MEPRGIPSRAGHVKTCLNPGGPPPKAKYQPVTDSELVPRGKGEKHPDKGSEKYLKSSAYTAVGAPSGVTACLLHNSLTHYTKGTQSPVRRQAPTACTHRVSGSISLPSPGFFSPFPHGTGYYRDWEYLGLEGGPPMFRQDCTCPALLEHECSHYPYGAITL